MSSTPVVPTGDEAVAGAVRHPGGPLPGLRYRYGGTATLTATAPPASAALPGANDVFVAGRAAGSAARPGGAVLLAAADSGIWRSADSGATLQRVLSGIQAWAVTPMTGGGYAALGLVPGPGAPGLTTGASQPELATSADGVSWHMTRVPELSAPPPFAAYAVSGPGADCFSPAELKKVQRLKPGWTPPSGMSVLYASSDGGARWDASGLVLPFGVQIGAAMAASGSRIAIIDACGHLELSNDAGEHWSGQPLGTAPICTVSMLGSQVWLYCQAGGPTWSLHSADGGATWLAYRLPAPAGQAPGIFLTGADSAVMPIGGALWRTRDGGKTWAEEWVLPR